MLDASFWEGHRVLLSGHTCFKERFLLWLEELGTQV